MMKLFMRLVVRFMHASQPHVMAGLFKSGTSTNALRLKGASMNHIAWTHLQIDAEIRRADAAHVG